MRVLVTGATGFVGRYLLSELKAQGHAAYGLDLGAPPPDLPVDAFVTADICRGDALPEAVARLRPDACVHLAAMAFVPSGKSSPVKMTEVNVMGTTRLLDAFRAHAPEARILFVSTAQVYGTRPRLAPVTEDDPLFPESLYGITKSAADGIARFFARQYGMPVMVARPYNHIGPGQAPDYVVASFASQVRAIREGAPAAIRVGNLESRRDFTDVRDIVRAYRLLLEKGAAGEAYNIASGRHVRIADVLARLCDLAGVQPRIDHDAALHRPVDHSLVLDITRLRQATGWAPAVPLETTLKDLVA